MSRVDDGSDYEDVFVFEDLVYAMERRLGVVHVYMIRNNSLIKLHDIRYPCECSVRSLSHSIIVTNEHIIQSCPLDTLVSIMDRSFELLWTIPVADISGPWPHLCQVDVEGNILIADHVTNRLLIAHVNQPSSQWRVVNLPDLPHSDGCYAAVWFRHMLYATDYYDRLLTFTPVDAQSLYSPNHLQF